MIMLWLKDTQICMYQQVCTILKFNTGKWVAKLRTVKTDNNVLFLDTNMDAGHGGASGRFEALKELAKEFSFLLDLEGIEK